MLEERVTNGVFHVVLAAPDNFQHCRVSVLQAFRVVEKTYFESIDDALAERANLSNFVPPHNEVHRHQHKLWRSLQAD